MGFGRLRAQPPRLLGSAASKSSERSMQVRRKAIDRGGDRVISFVSIRDRMHVLDSCLDALESARQRGHTVVQLTVAKAIRRHVHGIWPGMSIVDALGLVFDEQETEMRRRSVAHAIDRVPVRTVHKPRLIHSDVELADLPDVELTDAEARTLTEQIKTSARQTSLLLLEAHRRRAWSALGYATWGLYVREEFGISRSRSYELLDHACVLRQIMRAMGMSEVPDISPYAAVQVKPHVNEVIAEIRQRTSPGQATSEVRAVIAASVNAVRSVSVEAHGISSRSAAKAGSAGWALTAKPVMLVSPSKSTDSRLSIDRDRLGAVIDYLASLPPVEEVSELVPGLVGSHVENLRIAVRWLNALAEKWESKARREHKQLGVSLELD